MSKRPDFRLVAQHAVLYHTERLAMRQMSHSDLWPLWNATRHPEFNKGVLWSQPDDPVDVARRTIRLSLAAECGDIAAVSAVLRETGQWGAVFRYLMLDEDLELGLWSHPTLWGNGIGTEVTRLAVFAAFLEVGVTSMCARVAASNRPAVRVLEKAGLTYAGEYPSKHESLGVVERQLFRITREQFQNLPPEMTAVAHNITRFDPISDSFEVLAHHARYPE